MRPSFQFCWMWIFLWIKLSRHSCSMWDKLGWLIDSGNFSVGSYIPLIWKDSITHIHGLVVYVKEGLSFALSFVWKSLVFQIVGWSLKYYFDRCSSELAQVVPLPYSRGRSTHYSDRLHDFSVTIFVIDVTSLPVSTVSFLAQLDSGIHCQARRNEKILGGLGVYQKILVILVRKIVQLK